MIRLITDGSRSIELCRIFWNVNYYFDKDEKILRDTIINR